jgi:hypothetical protein
VPGHHQAARRHDEQREGHDQPPEPGVPVRRPLAEGRDCQQQAEEERRRSGEEMGHEGHPIATDVKRVLTAGEKFGTEVGGGEIAGVLRHDAGDNPENDRRAEDREESPHACGLPDRGTRAFIGGIWKRRNEKMHARHRPARVDRLALIGPGRRRRDHLATIAHWHLG